MNNVGDKVRAYEKFECGCEHTEYLGIVNGREEPYTIVEPCKEHRPKPVEVLLSISRRLRGRCGKGWWRGSSGMALPNEYR